MNDLCREPLRFAARLVLTAALATVLALAAVACSRDGSGHDAPVRAEPVALDLWTHGGTAAERAVLAELTDGFERAHPSVRVRVRVVPEGDYTTTLQAATAAGELPDVFDLDGPLVASFAVQDALAPLDGLVDERTLANMTPTMRAQGSWDGRLWALGTFDSGLGLWADRQALARVGARVPQGVDDAWSAAEFVDVLAALAAVDADGKVLDLKLGYGVGEWLTYGFAPLLSSAGGGLSRLDSRDNVRALDELGRWRGYVDPDAGGDAFVRRRVSLSWVGHWTYPEYRAALGPDLLLLPLPDLGRGSMTGSGSWAWAVSRGTPHAATAADLLEHLAADASVHAVTRANGALPGTRSVLEQARPVAADPRRLYYEQRDAGRTVPRPSTPDYPAVTAAFASAVHRVLAGTPAATALREAGAAVR